MSTLKADTKEKRDYIVDGILDNVYAAPESDELILIDGLVSYDQLAKIVEYLRKETEIPIISEMAFKYANDKVEEKGQYIKYDFQKRKELTTFDGYEIEQSYEDGAKAMSEYFIRRFFSDGDAHIEYIKLLTKTDCNEP